MPSLARRSRNFTLPAVNVRGREVAAFGRRDAVQRWLRLLCDAYLLQYLALLDILRA